MLTSIGGLHKLDKLTVLRLNHNRIRRLDSSASSDRRAAKGAAAVDAGSGSANATGHGLSGLASLEILQLGYNHVTDISSLNLHMLPELKVMFLQGNDIVRVDGMSSCFKLRELGALGF